MSNNGKSGSSPSVRVDIKDSLNYFSTLMEYRRYQYDFYIRNWFSVRMEVSDEQREKEIDLAYAEYYSSMCEEFDDDFHDEVVVYFISIDTEVDDVVDEDDYGKDRISRSMNRKQRWRSKVRDHETASVLSKKSRKYISETRLPHKREKVIFDSSTEEFDENGTVSFSEDGYKIIAHPTRFPKNFYEKGQYVDKRDKYFPHNDDSHEEEVSPTTVAREVLESSTASETKRARVPYFKRNVGITQGVKPCYAKKACGKKFSNVDPNDKHFVAYRSLPDLHPFSYRYCHGIGMYF